MSLKIKLMSMISAFILVLSMLLVGVLAATQTINLKGTVNFNISDRTLYLKDMRIQTESTGKANTAENFMPGFIGGEIDINLGTISSSSGTVNVYFDFVNTTSSVYQATATGGSGVTLSTSGAIAGSQVAIEDVATADISGTIILTIQFTGSSSIDLDGITITFTEYVEESIYTRLNENGEPDENGDYILFGYYPQSLKASNIIVNNTVDDRGYYLGSDGEYYAEGGDGDYYLVEPLLWRILTEDFNGTGNALVVSYKIIDAIGWQTHCTESGDYCYATEDDNTTILIDETATVGQGVDSQHRVYANNYKHSEIRAWLNDTFYSTAFTATEQEYIVTTEVDNSLESTLGYGGDYICENTNDKIFLLSMEEVHNTDYGYQPVVGEDDPYKLINVTDYSISKGAYFLDWGEEYGGNCGQASLRSPDVIEFGWGGEAVDDVSLYYFPNHVATSHGVVPALQIML